MPPRPKPMGRIAKVAGRGGKERDCAIRFDNIDESSIDSMHVVTLSLDNYYFNESSTHDGTWFCLNKLS